MVILSVSVLVATGCSVSGSDESERFSGSEITHEATGAVPEELPVPTTVSEAGWTWEAPEGSRVERVLPVPTGAVVHLSNGAAAVDTATGDTLWSYQVAEAVAQVSVSPDGGLAVVSAEGWAAVLDSATGEERQVFEHGHADDGALSIHGAGLVAGDGLVALSSGDEGPSVSLEPWEGTEGAWSSQPLTCPDGGPAPEIRQAMLTDARVVLVQECGPTAVMAALDLTSGEELWQLVAEEDFSYSSSYGFGEVGDVAVLETIGVLRGTVAIDVENGEVISDELPDGLDNDLLRVLPDGYLAVRQRGDRLDYELRDFSGGVRETAALASDDVAGTVTGFLPLRDALLKLTLADGGGTTEVSVLAWGSQDDGRQISLPVDTDVLDLSSLSQLDAAVGPGSFEAAPGAVLMREYSESNPITRIVGLV